MSTLCSLLAAAVLLLLLPAATVADLGINLGNVLEAPTEGAWAPAAQEYYFDDYASRNFSFVRIPVRWDKHTGTSAPYAVDATFLARVHEVAGWALARNLSVVVNSHHDDWQDVADDEAFRAALPRFVALWAQVAASFSEAPLALAFEVFNEFHLISIANANALYAAVLPVMRAGGGNNGDRAVYLGGLSWMSPNWIDSNPDAIVWPKLANGAEDPNLRLEVHSYDPHHFCLESPPTQQSWGSAADRAAVTQMYANMSAWSAAHGGRAVLMGEAGCQIGAPSRPDRLAWYATVAAAARSSLAGRISIWDDDGTWKIYNRDQRTWDEGVMSALGL